MAVEAQINCGYKANLAGVCWWRRAFWANLGEERRTLANQQARSALDASSLSPRSSSTLRHVCKAWGDAGEPQRKDEG